MTQLIVVGVPWTVSLDEMDQGPNYGDVEGKETLATTLLISLSDRCVGNNPTWIYLLGITQSDRI